MNGELAYLIADIVGSARLYGALPEAEAAAAELRCQQVMRTAVTMFGGRVTAAEGDELLAEFDVADDAWRAAREIQVQIGDLPAIGGLRLASRVGLHRGPPGTDPVGAGPARAVALLAVRAGGGQVLASRALLESLSPPVTAQILEPAQTAMAPELGDGFLMAWHPATVHRREPLPPATACLKVIQQDGVRWLDSVNQPELSIGRDPACDVVINDRRASRQHGRLVCRDGEVRFIDASTNGSFVSQGQREQFVRHEEIRLERSGKICFGGSANDPGAVCLRFELIDQGRRST